jgi:hypothetical protein
MASGGQQTLDRQAPMCVHMPSTSPSLRFEEFRASLLLSSRCSVASIPQVAKALTALILSATRLCNSADAVRSFIVSTSLTPLKL